MEHDDCAQPGRRQQAGVGIRLQSPFETYSFHGVSVK